MAEKNPIAVELGRGGGRARGSWGLLAGNMPNTPAQVDFSYRGVHASTVVAQSITTNYYGSSPISYLDGCSTGGREALVEAQKFPKDYNGIVAGDPAISDPIAGFNWNDQALLSRSDAYLPPSAIAILDAAVTAACDGSDGVKDGMQGSVRHQLADNLRISFGRLCPQATVH
jgi:feruloyl esterase